MLSFFKKYVVLTYVCTIAVPVLITLVSFVMAGGIIMPTVATVLSGFILLLSCFFLFQTSFRKRAEAEAQAHLNAYNEGCDPELFYQAGTQVAAEIEKDLGRRPKETVDGVWYLAAYALAAADLGHADEAERYAQALLNAVPAQTSPLSQAIILVHMEPLILRLHGAEAAKAVLTQASACLEGQEGESAAMLQAFLGNETRTVDDMIAGNTTQLVAYFMQIMRNEEQPMRMRVLYADAASQILAGTNDARERACLQFVVENGNALPVVEPAKQRLAAL